MIYSVQLINLKNLLLVVFLQIVSKCVSIHQGSPATGEDLQTLIKHPGIHPGGLLHFTKLLLQLLGQLVLQFEGLEIVHEPVPIEEIPLQLGLHSVFLFVSGVVRP